jgi:hypothetical protein
VVEQKLNLPFYSYAKSMRERKKKETLHEGPATLLFFLPSL